MLREESAYALKEIAFCIFTVILQLASTWNVPSFLDKGDLRS